MAKVHIFKSNRSRVNDIDTSEIGSVPTVTTHYRKVGMNQVCDPPPTTECYVYYIGDPGLL